MRGPADYSPHRSSCFCVSVLNPRARVTLAEGVAPIGGTLHMAVPSVSTLVLPGGSCPVLPSDLGCEGVFAHTPPSSCSSLFCTTLAQRPRPSQCPPRPWKLEGCMGHTMQARVLSGACAASLSLSKREMKSE